MNRSMRRLYLICPNTGSIVVFRLAVELAAAVGGERVAHCVSAVVPGTVTKLPASVGVARRCALPGLSLTVCPLDQQAGSSYDVFILKNTTTTMCSVRGVARLSIATAT